MKRYKHSIKGGRVHRKQIKKRLLFVTVCYCLMLLSLTFRLYHIQVITGIENLESLTTPGEIIQLVLKKMPVIK
ncbi:MAG: hypothetical protein ACOX4U_01955 [Anaerovoracaceae bacterium]